MKKNITSDFITFTFIILLIYEIIALKFNFFSLTLYLFSKLLIITPKNNLNIYKVNSEYYNILVNLAYNNEFIKLSNVLKSQTNINNIKIIALADIISKEKEYFYINKGYDNGVKVKDIVTNEENILGIVIQTYPEMSKVKYILSSEFEIMSYIKDTPYLGITKYINNNLIFIPFDIYSKEKLKSNTNFIVLSYGFSSLPTGIPIGYIYDTNSLTIVIKKDLPNSLHTLILRRI